MIRFAAVDDARLHCRASREWGGISANRIHATAGRHAADPRPDHRLVFYETGGMAAECGCEGVRRVHTLTPGAFDLVPAGASGYWEDSAPVQFVSVRLDPRLLTETAEALAIRGSIDLAPRIGARDAVIEPIVRALASEIEAPQPAARIYADSLGAALASRLLQSFMAAGAPRRRGLSKPQQRRIADFVEANLADDLPLERIAAEASLSVPHLTALFRRTMGQSVHRYVMERRVQRARALLQDRRLSTSEVAYACGFSHQSHLARWTRRVLGATPSQIREP